MKPRLPKFFAKKILFIVALGFYLPATAQVNVDLSAPLITGLSLPMQFVSANDGSQKIYIPQKGGSIVVYDNGFTPLGSLLTITDIVSTGEQGLLSLVFHPDYQTNGLFFVYHNNSAGNLVLARYKISSTNPNQADVASRVEVLNIPHVGYANHNGGELHFGADGFLYLSTGDGGGGGDPNNNAQNDAVLLGKMLRLQVNTSLTPPYYSIPAGNPPGSLVYNKGLRNPYRWSFDRLTHDMWIGDVGQNSWEEINFRAAANISGSNYGWRCYEGNATYNTSGCGPIGNYVFPVHTYPNAPGPVSVTGGTVYRGSLYPSYQGQYLASDYYTGDFFHIVPNAVGGFTTLVQPSVKNNIVDFGEDEQGELFAVSLTAGEVYRVIPRAVTPVNLTTFNAVAHHPNVNLYWKTEQETQLVNYEIEYSNNGTQFITAGTVPARNTLAAEQYHFLHEPVQAGYLFYRLKINNADGSFKYSAIIKVNTDEKSQTNFVQPSVIDQHLIKIYLPKNFTKLELYNSLGARVLLQNISNQTGTMQLPVPQLASGIYFIRLSNKTNFLQQKIVIP